MYQALFTIQLLASHQLLTSHKKILLLKHQLTYQQILKRINQIKLESNSVLNEINIDETKSNDNKIGLESNISLPEQTNEINFNTKVVKNSEDLIKEKIYTDKLDKSKTIEKQNTKLASNSKIFPNNSDKKILKKNEADNNINLEDVDNDNAFYISPPKLDERASNIQIYFIFR